MNELFAFCFEGEYEADEVRTTLLKMRRDHLVDLEDAVVAVRDQEGKIKVRVDKIEEDDDKLWDDLRLISEYGNSMYADVPPSWKPKSILKHTEFKYYEKVLDSDNPLYVYRRAQP